MDAMGRKRLKLAGFRRYSDYLRSAKWRKFTAMWPVMTGLPARCSVPGCGSKRIQYHHLTYQRLGRERVGDVMPLCGRHHRRLHLLQKHRHRRYGSFQEVIGVLSPSVARKPHRKRSSTVE
jgi:hypothetical protein